MARAVVLVLLALFGFPAIEAGRHDFDSQQLQELEAGQRSSTCEPDVAAVCQAKCQGGSLSHGQLITDENGAVVPHKYVDQFTLDLTSLQDFDPETQRKWKHHLDGKKVDCHELCHGCPEWMGLPDGSRYGVLEPINKAKLLDPVEPEANELRNAFAKSREAPVNLERNSGHEVNQAARRTLADLKHVEASGGSTDGERPTTDLTAKWKADRQQAKPVKLLDPVEPKPNELRDALAKSRKAPVNLERNNGHEVNQGVGYVLPQTKLRAAEASDEDKLFSKVSSLGVNLENLATTNCKSLVWRQCRTLCMRSSKWVDTSSDDCKIATCWQCEAFKTEYNSVFQAFTMFLEKEKALQDETSSQQLLDPVSILADHNAAEKKLIRPVEGVEDHTAKRSNPVVHQVDEDTFSGGPRTKVGHQGSSTGATDLESLVASPVHEVHAVSRSSSKAVLKVESLDGVKAMRVKVTFTDETTGIYRHDKDEKCYKAFDLGSDNGFAANLRWEMSPTERGFCADAVISDAISTQLRESGRQSVEKATMVSASSDNLATGADTRRDEEEQEELKLDDDDEEEYETEESAKLLPVTAGDDHTVGEARVFSLKPKAGECPSLEVAKVIVCVKFADRRNVWHRGTLFCKKNKDKKKQFALRWAVTAAQKTRDLDEISEMTQPIEDKCKSWKTK